MPAETSLRPGGPTSTLTAAREPSLDDYRLLVETVQDYAIFMLDPDGHVTTWSSGAAKMKGYAANEIIGAHFSVFYEADAVAAGKPARELTAAEAQGRVEDEGWRVRKDGSRFWASVVVTALRNPDGSLRGFAKITRDLTHERRAQEELRRSEERFRLLVEGVTDYAIYLLDPEGYVSTWNSGAQAIKGYTADEIIGRHFSQFFTREDVEREHPAHELRIARSEGRFEEEGWRVRKDGTRFWAGVVVTALADARGELIGFAKVTRDLTARRAAEETARELVREQAARAAAAANEEHLREERERYRALSRRLEVILEGVADGITVQGRDGALLFANVAATTMCAFASAAALARAITDAPTGALDVCDEHGDALRPDELPGRRVLGGASTATALLRIRDRATGREWWPRLRVGAVLGEGGQPDLAISIWHDVTADRRRDAQERCLARATAALAWSLDADAMMATLAAHLVPSLADGCAIHLCDGAALVPVAFAPSATAGVLRAPTGPARTHGVWSVLRTGEAELREFVRREWVDAVAGASEPLAPFASLGMLSAMIVPIRGRDRVLGTISLVTGASARRFDRADLALGEELGRRAGAAIENANLYAAERRARERLELLARAGEALSATVDSEATLRRAVEVALPVLGDFAMVDLVDGDAIRRVAAAHDDPEAARMLEETAWRRTPLEATRGDVTYAPEAFVTLDALAESEEHRALLRRLALTSWVKVPLRVHGDVLGALTVGFGRSGRRHTPDDATLAEELARRAALAIVQARLYEGARAAALRAEDAARRAEEASRVKDEFLATVSHELRTPLNAMLGWSSILRARSESPWFAKGLDVIRRNAQSQSRIIDDILDVSRIVTGKLRLELAPVDLVAVVGAAIEVVAPSAAARAIAIQVTSSAPEVALVADRDRLQQAIWNLLSNAVKFTDPGGRVRVHVEQVGADVSLTVTDTGRGIDADFLPLVFDRFKQADGSTTRRVGGLGLGLAIVRHIVELHGGHARASSDGPGKGATFAISLPVRAVLPAAPPEPTPAPSASRRASPPQTALGGVRVLIVDDEADARELLDLVLTDAGALVETAASAAEAFARLPQLRPHVLVSDIGMPDEDGYSFIRRVRALAPADGGTIPSIALTAYTRVDDQRKALAAGFTTHLGKPVNPEDLVAAVANVRALAKG